MHWAPHHLSCAQTASTAELLDTGVDGVCAAGRLDGVVYMDMQRGTLLAALGLHARPPLVFVTGNASTLHHLTVCRSCRRRRADHGSLSPPVPAATPITRAAVWCARKVPAIDGRSASGCGGATAVRDQPGIDGDANAAAALCTAAPAPGRLCVLSQACAAVAGLRIITRRSDGTVQHYSHSGTLLAATATSAAWLHPLQASQREGVAIDVGSLPHVLQDQSARATASPTCAVCCSSDSSHPSRRCRAMRTCSWPSACVAIVGAVSDIRAGWDTAAVVQGGLLREVPLPGLPLGAPITLELPAGPAALLPCPDAHVLVRPHWRLWWPAWALPAAALLAWIVARRWPAWQPIKADWTPPRDDEPPVRQRRAAVRSRLA